MRAYDIRYHITTYHIMISSCIHTHTHQLSCAACRSPAPAAPAAPTAPTVFATPLTCRCTDGRHGIQFRLSCTTPPGKMLLRLGRAAGALRARQLSGTTYREVSQPLPPPCRASRLALLRASCPPPGRAAALLGTGTAAARALAAALCTCGTGGLTSRLLRRQRLLLARVHVLIARHLRSKSLRMLEVDMHFCVTTPQTLVSLH